MKRILAVVLLLSTSVQAGAAHDFWMSLGKNSRLASGVKTVIVGMGAVAAGHVLRHAAPKSIKDLGSFWDKHSMDNAWTAADTTVIAGSTLYALYVLGFHYLPEHTKHALNMKSGWFS